MWVVVVNALASVLALINFLIGAGGNLHWMWLISCICFALIAVREYRKLGEKEQ